MRLENLFGSKIRCKILRLFYEKQTEFYIQQIIKMTADDASNVHRELRKLSEMGILKSEKRDHRVYYALQKENAYVGALGELFKREKEVFDDEKEAWVVAEEIPFGLPIIVPYFQNEYVRKYFVKIGMDASIIYPTIMLFENSMLSIIIPTDKWKRHDEAIFEWFREKPENGFKHIARTFLEIQKLHEVAELCSKENWREMNLKNMGEKMKAIFEQLINVHITGRIHNLDLSDSVFSGYLLDYLRSKIHGKDMSENVGEVFSVLTTPLEESLAQKEYADILAILESIKGDEKLLSTYQNFDTPIILKTIRQKFLKNYQRIVKHVERYGWLGYGYSGPAWGEEYFVDILASLSKQKVSLSEYSKAEEEKRSVIMARQKEYFAKLGIDDRHKKLLEIAREFVFLKGARKDAMFHWYSALEFPYRELARRFFLSLKQVRYYYWWEWLDILSKEKKVDANLLNERIAYHIYYCDEKDNFHTVNGDDAKKFLGRFQIMTPDISNINELNGDCASPGKVRAKTVLVNTKQDMQKMKKGDILVSTATMPELMPAIKLASAIITDMGGITCHAAIVSRELGIPCVIGTKIATKVLKDGTTVEVDASHGRVRIITS